MLIIQKTVVKFARYIDGVDEARETLMIFARCVDNPKTVVKFANNSRVA